MCGALGSLPRLERALLIGPGVRAPLHAISSLFGVAGRLASSTNGETASVLSKALRAQFKGFQTLDGAEEAFAGGNAA